MLDPAPSHPSFSRDVWRPRNQAACREQLGLPADRFLVLIHPDNADEARALMQAVARIPIPDFSVVINGSSPEGASNAIALMVSDPDDAAALHWAVDVVVAPILTEVCRQRLMEALACGTAAVGYTADAAVHAMWAGVPGVLVSHGDPASIAAAIRKLYAEPYLRNDLGVWGRLHAENEWTDSSAYRHIFLALDRAGLRERLHLRPRIQFIPGLATETAPAGNT